ncbi:AAA family ATPase [Terrabacter sp. LjRoot27]|uniref:ParA family protein n=1 Tax=Terrabacter sp. LjRoot27 TaxID=3342306 RepID=UPI003F5008B9
MDTTTERDDEETPAADDVVHAEDGPEATADGGAASASLESSVEPAEPAGDGTVSDTEAPGVQPDPVESAHDPVPADDAPPPAEMVTAVDSSDPAPTDEADSDAGSSREALPSDEAGGATPEAHLPEVGDAQYAASAPVDNAVDDSSGNAPVERETTANEAGDNVVDEARRASELTADHADREALAAAIPTAGQDTPLAMELAENARRRIQLTGRPFPKPVGPRVLTVANQKGGVGKTTTTVNVAAALAQSGLKALVIDLDPQGNASTALGIDHHAEVPSIYDVLVDGTPLLDVVQRCTTVENLYCAPATIDLAGAEIELVSLVARESRLQKAIAAAAESGHEFDYILIDCPPSLGLLTVNAMVAASEVFIPIQCEYYALEGLSQLLKNIDLVRLHLNPALHVSTILLTMYDGRTRLSAQVADEVREHFPTEVLRTSVPRSVRVSEAPSFGETVMTYDPASSGALAYLEAAGEIADRGAAGRT